MLLLIGAAPFEPPHAGTRTIYRHAALIDGTGRPIERDMAVETDGQLISTVVADSALTPAQLKGATQVDLTGKYLLPGYIDSHQHLATPPDRPEAEARLKRDIYSGITGTRDMADDIRQIMWDNAGIDRTAKGLRKCIEVLDEIKKRLPVGATEEGNMADTARLIAEAALMRKESRGGHYRADYPRAKKTWKGRHIEL